MSHLTKLFFIVICLHAFTLDVAKGSEIQFGALSQMHFSLANSDTAGYSYGFRVRRIDIRAWNAPTNKFDWSLLVGFNNFKFQILEIDANFHFSNFLNLRVGQIAPPAVRSGAPVDNLYRVPTMILIERPPITQYWAKESNLHAYRTLGIQLHGKIFNDKLYYAAMVGNPIGELFFKASSASYVNTVLAKGISLWGRLEYYFSEKVVAGIFSNNSHYTSNGKAHEISTYGGHFLSKRGRATIMTEFIGGIKSSDNIQKDTYSGYYIEAAYCFGKIEPAFRFDVIDPLKFKTTSENNIRSGNLTFGINWYFSDIIKVQSNYVLKYENKNAMHNVDNNLFYINLQFFLN